MHDHAAEQQALLEAHRRSLSVCLHQLALFGQAHVPPHVVHGVQEHRRQIAIIKNYLRLQNVPVEESPSDQDEINKNEQTPSSENLVIDFCFNETGLVYEDRRDIAAKIILASSALSTGVKVQFTSHYSTSNNSVNINSILSNNITAEEKLKIALAYKQSVVNSDIESEISQAVPVLFEFMKKHLYLQVFDTIDALNNLPVRQLELRNFVIQPRNTTIDIFRKFPPALSTVIQIDESEVADIVRVKNMNSIYEFVGTGWDIFDLPNSTRVSKAIPAIIFEVIDYKQRVSREADIISLLNINHWSVGLR